MKQISLAMTGFESITKTMWKAEFLAEMERLMPWAEICALIAPHYPKVGNGRPPIGAFTFSSGGRVLEYSKIWTEINEGGSLSEILCVRHTMLFERSR